MYLLTYTLKKNLKYKDAPLTSRGPESDDFQRAQSKPVTGLLASRVSDYTSVRFMHMWRAYS